MRHRVAALVLALSTSCVDSLPPRSGVMLWTVPGSSAGTPAFDALSAYFLTREHAVVAVNKRTGQVRWTQPTGLSGPRTDGSNAISVGDAVVVGDDDIHAFHRLTGRRLWRFHTTVGYYPGLFDLSTDGTQVFAGSPSGHVFAIDGRGGQRWRVHLKDNAEDMSAYGPVYANGRVFVCFTRFSWPRTGGIAALDAETGEEVWRVDFPQRPPSNQGGCYARVAVTGSIVVGATHDGHVYAHDQASGALAWAAPQLLDAEGTAGSPQMDVRPLAAGDGVVVVGSSTTWVVALDAANGAELWRNSPRAGSVIFPIEVSGGAAYTVGGALELTSFDLKTGALRWSLGVMTDINFTARPAVDGDRIYIGGPEHMSALRR